MVRWISPIDSLTVLPSSRVRSLASSSFSLSMSAWTWKRIRPRTGAGVSRQPWKAACAASTAARVSSALERGRCPSTSRVSAGLMLGTERVDSELTHCPFTKFR